MIRQEKEIRLTFPVIIPVLILLFLMQFSGGCSQKNTIQEHNVTITKTTPEEKPSLASSPEETKEVPVPALSPTSASPAVDKSLKPPTSSLFVPYEEDYNPTSPGDKLVYEGDMFFRRGKFTEAINKYRDALNEDPKLDYAQVRIGDICLRRGEYEAADQAFTAAIDINPKNKEAWFGHADMLLEDDKIDESRKALEKVLEIDPKFALTYTSLGDIYVETKEWDKAEKMFLKSLEMDPNQKPPDTYIGLGDMYFRSKRFENAYKYYTIATQKDPYDIDGFLGRANSLLGMQRFDEAEKVFHEAMEVHPEHLESKLMCARFYIGLGKFDKADKLLKRIVKIHGDDDRDVQETLKRFEQARKTKFNPYKGKEGPIVHDDEHLQSLKKKE